MNSGKELFSNSKGKQVMFLIFIDLKKKNYEKCYCLLSKIPVTVNGIDKKRPFLVNSIDNDRYVLVCMGYMKIYHSSFTIVQVTNKS